MSWLEVELTLDPELVEPVAELLARYCQQGVSITQIETDNGAVDPSGALVVRGYLPQDREMEDKVARIERGLWHLSQIQAIPAPSFQTVEDQDWNARWREHYRPLEVGERLLILPSWVEVPATDRLPIRIDPGMAFGTGTHPSTRLALLAIESMVEEGIRFADIGTGSGILSIAALRLGAERADAVDSDRTAVELAAANAALNGLGDRFLVRHGTYETLTSLALEHGWYGLLAANILAPVLVELLSTGIGDLVLSRGSIVLSGILEEQQGEMEAAIHKAGLRIDSRLTEADWLAYTLRKK